MSKILISYRREDSADVTGRIYDRLIQQFGREAVFKDVDSIPFGVDFRTYLDQQVAKCDVFLAVIGREWMRTKGRKGKSRLEDPRDFVRIELESALRRQVPVIPLLVRGASIPDATKLPASIQDLSYRHGIEVRSDPDFHRDMDRLIAYLKEQIRDVEGQRAEPASSAVQDPAGPDERMRRASPDGMVLVPKGPFLYGDEKRHITIEHDYHMDIYPVTNERYKGFMRARGYGNRKFWSDAGWRWRESRNIEAPKYWEQSRFYQPDHPVVGVSYYEAEAYAKWSGKRLPTEEEWEKAARGTDGRKYPWGDEFSKEKCNSYESGNEGTTPVSKYVKGQSPYGCYDMAGNVWEWTASRYANEDGRVKRGGAWYGSLESLRTSGRDRGDADDRGDDLGFRLAEDVLK